MSFVGSMEITRHNLESSLPVVKAAIEAAEFIAFDTEFTGLDCGVNGSIRRGDSESRRYDDLRPHAKAFRVIQLGIACFRRAEAADEQENALRYVSEGFSLFIWPTECKELSIRPTVTVEVDRPMRFAC